MRKNFVDELQTFIREQPASLREAAISEVETVSARQIHSRDDLVRLMRNSNISTRARTAAAWLLGQLRYKKAAKALLEMVNQPDKSLIWEGAKALGAIKSRSAIRTLVACLKSDNAERRAAAAYALGLMREALAVGPLIKLLRRGKETARVKGHAAEALGYIQDKRAFDALVSALEDPAAEVRFWSAFALGELRDPRAIPYLKELAEKDSSRVRRGALVKDEAQSAVDRLSDSRKL